MNIEVYRVSDFNSDSFKKLEQWEGEKKWAINSNNILLQSGIITFQEWLKRDTDIRNKTFELKP